MVATLRDSRPVAHTLGDNRQTMRRAVTLRAALRDRGATKFEIKVVDLSPTGFRAESIRPLKPGTSVWVGLPGLGSLEAVVAWQDRLFVGCAFRTPLHPAVFEHVVELCRR